MKIKHFFAAMMVAIVALAAWSCNDEPDVAPAVKPTIGIMEPELNTETMEVSVMIAPSTDATAWYWRVVEETRTEDGGFTKEEGAAAKEIKFSVVYGVVYTIEAYAENKAGSSDTATKNYCPMPEGELAITIGEATLDEESMLAKVEVYPSKVATAWYWSVAEQQETESTEWTEVENNGTQEITFAYEWGKSVEFRVYAECGTLRSDVVAKEVYFAPAIPTITVSKPHFDESSMTVSYDVTPSEDTHHWYYGIYDDAEDANYTTVEGSEAATVTFKIDYDKEYQFIFRAENILNEGEEKISDFSVISPVAEIAIENLTAYTIDAVVTMKEHCVRYVAGAVHTTAYDRNIFIEQAQTSLNPDPSYPFAVFNSATESRTFTEQDLVRNSRLDSDENAGIILLPGTSYTIAVYGEDAKGNYTVTTEEIVVPKAVINGSTAISVAVSDVDLTTATATVTAASACKILTGYIDPAVAKGDTSVPFDFEGKSDEEIKAYIVSAVKGVPTIYSEPISYSIDMLANDTEYVVYAVAIKDGKIGDVAFTTFKTLRPSLTGEAKISAATIETQTSHEILTVKVTADSKAEFVRIYAAPASDHTAYANNLEYIMDADEYQNYREEYDVVDGVATAEINIYHPGTNYYIYASAVDASGRAGEMVCVAQLAGLETEYYTTMEEVITDEGNSDFNGTGTATLNVEIIDTVDDRISAKLTATNFSSNVDKVWLFRFNGMISEIEDVIKENLSEYPNRIYGSYKIAKEGIAINYIDGGSSWDPKYEALQEYDDKWGGDIVVMVVLDTDGKVNICSYYVAGREVVVC